MRKGPVRNGSEDVIYGESSVCSEVYIGNGMLKKLRRLSIPLFERGNLVLLRPKLCLWPRIDQTEKVGFVNVPRPYYDMK